MNVTAETAFGTLLRRYRQAAGLTQEELAERTGLSVRGLNYLERGRRQPYPDTVQRLAAALDLAEPERTALTQAARQDRTSAYQSITPSASPPPQAAAAPLPASGAGTPWPATPLLGRERELEELGMLLRWSDGRLVTLTGPAGVGKTHLALQVAATLQEQFAHGVILVSLAPLRYATLVLPALAQALGLRETPDQLLVDVLAAALHGQERLLLLDNCEQVVEAAPQLAALLAACPRLRLLATSRTPLRLRAEQEYPLTPLALPDLAALPPVTELAQVPAVALFEARAQAIKPAFALTAANASAVAEVCVRLDGLPLAIELAAARIKLFAPQQLAVRLERRLPLLVGGARDLPERQRTMRGAIAWSHALLTVAEQVLFRRLAVFVGGGSLEAVLTVCTGEASPDDGDMLDWLEGLVDHHLLRLDLTSEGEPRYGMLETLREYGLEQLAASGEEEQLRARHATYYLALAERAEPESRGPQQALWFARLEREHDNLREVLRWARERDDTSMLLRMVLALGWFWIMHGHIDEWHHWIDTLLQMNDWPVSPDVRVHTLNLLGQVTREFGDYGRSRALHEQELNLCRQSNDMRGIADALYCLGYVAQRSNDYPAAIQLQEESVATARSANDPWLLATTLNFLAYTLVFQGHYERARILADEALELRQHEQEQRGIAQSLWELGMIAHYQGNTDEAATRYEESAAILRQLGDLFALGYVLCDQADLLRRNGDNVQARVLLEESLSYRQQMHDVWGQGVSQGKLGIVAQQESKIAEASAFYRKSLTIFQRLNDQWGIASTLESVASLRHQPEAAIQLYATAARLRETVGTPLPPVDRAAHEEALSSLRDAVGTATFTQLWAAGQAAPLEQVIADALDSIDSTG